MNDVVNVKLPWSRIALVGRETILGVFSPFCTAPDIAFVKETSLQNKTKHFGRYKDKEYHLPILQQLGRPISRCLSCSTPFLRKREPSAQTGSKNPLPSSTDHRKQITHPRGRLTPIYND